MPKPTLRFTRIQLENWRNFRQLDVQLGDRVFLVGPNASGKSNFLDAFRFLHDIVRTRGGFQPAVDLRGGFSNLRHAAAPSGADVRVAVTIGTEDQPDLWEYDVCFNESRHLGPLLKTERICHAGACELSRPAPSDQQDPLSLTQTILEQVSLNQKFRPIVDLLLSVLYLHLVPQLVRDPERSPGKSADPFGGDFLEQIADVPARLRTARLRWICKVLQAAVPSLEALDIEHDARGVPHLRGKFQPVGHWKSETDFSDGTLRLIGLLWAHLASPAGPLILEEPELNLHPEVVRLLPQTLARMQDRRGQQVLLSTHSPDFLRDEGIGLSEVLLFIPGERETEVQPASSFAEIVTLLDGGINLADAVLPWTQPQGVNELARRIGH